MRIAIYSDAHGNIPAMEAFIKDSVERNVNCYEFLGDAVNYGGKPQECLDQIIKLGLVGHVKEINAFTDPATLDRNFLNSVYNNQLLGKILLGNNDAACCGLEDPDYFAGAAKDSAIITRKELLSEWHQTFLRKRPMEAPMNIRNEECEKGEEDWVIPVRYNHSAPGNLALGEWHYVRRDTNIEYLEYYMDYFPERICFVGHSHVPYAYVKVEQEIFPVCFPMPTKGFDKAIVNVGSIGQPREGKQDGSYVIIDSASKSIELIWFSYDIKSAMNDIFDAKLPEQNAHRLFYGRVLKTKNKPVPKIKKQ